jgi:hypothetical protein
MAGTGLVANTTFNGGTVAPGEVLTGIKVGNLTLSNTVWNSNTRYAWQLGDAALHAGNGGIAGTDWDFLTVSNLTLAAGQYGVDVSLLSISGFDLTPSGTNQYHIATAFGGETWDTNMFATIATWYGGTPTNGWGWWVTSSNANQELWLNYGYNGMDYGNPVVAIPEPNVLLLWLSSLATIYVCRRRLRAARQRPE